MSKTCKKCGKKKEEGSFYAAKGNTDGLRGSCKECINSVSSIYVAANKKNVALYKAKYHLENRAEINKYQENYRAENREQLNAKQKIYYAENTKSVAAYKESYYEKNRDRLSAKNARYYEANKEHLNAQQAKYDAKNKVRLNFCKAKSKKEKICTDPIFAMSCRVSHLMRQSLKSKGHTKKSRTSKILGCSAFEFYIHIERQFTKGMTWANRSEWHLDHIIPISSAETEDEILSLNNYLNLRPMWAKENLKKSNSLIYLI